ncbi:MAG: glycosyltransferase family 61 protein [Cyanobacteriota bacterium]|nr:glycosyltransferase family 61 protein [Cyanobacteriota bacterium]
MAPWLPLAERRGSDWPMGTGSNSPTVHVLQDAVIMPGSRGLHGLNGQPILESYLQRGPLDRPDYYGGLPEPMEPLAKGCQNQQWDNCLFIPYARLDHFGHLLTETTAWLWPCLGTTNNPLHWADSSMPVVLADHAEDGCASIAALLGLPANQVLSTASLTRPVVSRRVFLPMPSMVNRRWIAHHHINAVREIVGRVAGLSATDLARCRAAALDPTSPLRIYLSRGRLGPECRRLEGESVLEQHLARCGWLILHPQELTILDQLRLLARARVVAGEAGSAFHLLMVYGQDMAPKTIAMLGVRGLSRDPRMINFSEQLRQQPVDFHYLMCLGFKRRSPSPTAAHQQPIQGIDDRRFLVSPQRVANRLVAIANAGPRATTAGHQPGGRDELANSWR